MKLQTMFQKDINRDINGVIKVTQSDESSLRQELGEYIVTKELRRHFRTFFENYARAIDRPTDKIGVWISGFFGSGKSHFLKMLSYLLSGREVSGRRALDYLLEKLDDPAVCALAERCCSLPTESILFNIDIEGPVNKDKTAVLRTFAKVFYTHCGYYGDDLKIARLERFIARQGKTEAFRAAFEAVHGAPWVQSRDAFAFFEDDVVSVLQSVLGMSEQAARNWFNGEETNELSIAQLVADIEEYIRGRGEDFRLLFMVDEVGQYIGDDGDLMVNLQSLTEEIGNRCRGRVWVMVTSQEFLDSITSQESNDFSKIQERFDTRLSLTSSSVDEVIRKRVLAKTEEASALLREVYSREHAVLKNLFTFSGSVLDIKGFTTGEEFAAAFPFVPYQFLMIQKVLAEIRKHGNAGKSFSGAERSMLSGFQEAAQQVQERDEYALVPFHLFYDTVHKALESAIRRVIDRCQNAADNRDGLEQQDVRVLKLLYLLRYISEDIRASIDNIAVLMIDDIRTEKIALRASVAASLERLESQNYISRSGDTYAFLTDEEQEIAMDIRNTAVDGSKLTAAIAQIVFGEIYPSKKYQYGIYPIPYDQYIDEMLNGAACGGMRLRIVTVAGDYCGVPEQRLIRDSQVNNEAMVVLSQETPYFEELEQAAKIRQYVKQKNVSQLPESIQTIIRMRQQQARTLEERARTLLERAIAGARIIVHGEVMELRAGSARDKLDAVLHALVESVYFKLGMVRRFSESDADLLALLNSTDQEAREWESDNEEALTEISQWLEVQSERMLSTSMGDVQRRYGAIPYGWREIDIAALTARLIARRKISVKYGGTLVGREERRLKDYLRKRSEVDRAVVVRRIAPSEELMRKSAAFLRDYLAAMDIPSDEDGLVRFVLETFETRRDHYQQLLDEAYARYPYPERELVAGARDLMEDLLSQRRDPVALLTRMVQQQDALLDSAEDLEAVELFFKSQRTVFDEAVRLMERTEREQDYFSADPESRELFRTVSSILRLPRPYGRIGELPALLEKIREAYAARLELKREEVEETLRQCLQDVHQLAAEARDAAALLHQADDYFALKREAAAQAPSLTELDAMITQLLNYKDTVCRRMEILAAGDAAPDGGGGAGGGAHAPRITSVRRYDLCSVKRLQSRADIDSYVEGIREKLYHTLETCDGVQIN